MTMWAEHVLRSGSSIEHLRNNDGAVAACDGRLLADAERRFSEFHARAVLKGAQHPPPDCPRCLERYNSALRQLRGSSNDPEALGN